jgi:hypothetical protein
VVGLAPVERSLNVLPQSGIVDEVQNIDASQDVVQLPQRLLGLILPGNVTFGKLPTVGIAG